jgi:hypothetical protein
MTARTPIKKPAKTTIADLSQDIGGDFDDIAAFAPEYVDRVHAAEKRTNGERRQAKRSGVGALHFERS